MPTIVTILTRTFAHMITALSVASLASAHMECRSPSTISGIAHLRACHSIAPAYSDRASDGLHFSALAAE